MSALEPSDLWDRWSVARRGRPSLQPEEFARTLGDDGESALDVLRALVDLERQAEPPPLVEMLAPEAPTRFAGFRIIRSLGQGSSGVVFLAHDERETGTGGPVALKILNPLLAAAPERRDSILREARVAASLDHEGIVRVLASGVERGYAWIATEYVEGEPLGARIDAEIPGPERVLRAIDLTLQLVRALQHAHGRGVIHRDLKPANVMFTTGGRAKILDFGLARAEGTAFAVSRTGEAVGTPLYMAPEQWRTEGEIGPWTDVFAVGLIVWEIASGKRLAADTDLPSMLKQVTSHRRVSRAMLRRLPPTLGEIVSRCTEPHPHDRYADCTELERDLVAGREGRPLPIGSLSARQRAGRTWARRPVRCTALVLGSALLIWSAWYAWWTWPMPVHITVRHPGKQIRLDGRSVGTAPLSLALRPGHYDLQLNVGEGPAEARFDLTVEPRIPCHRTYILEPAFGVPLKPDELQETGISTAVVFVATPHEEIDLEIDGRAFADMPGITSFRLPFGSHRVLVGTQGRVSEERTFTIATNELTFLAADLEPQDSQWRKIVLYSPHEQRVRDGVIRTNGLRLYDEYLPPGWEFSSLVEKVYWGAQENQGEGEALVRISLPFPIQELALEREEGVDLTAYASGAWNALEMGPAVDDLHVVRSVRCDARGSPEEQTDAQELALLPGRLAGRTTLFLRFAIGGGSAGEDHAYASALRTNAIPYRPPGGPALWRPALTLRVKRAP